MLAKIKNTYDRQFFFINLSYYICNTASKSVIKTAVGDLKKKWHVELRTGLFFLLITICLVSYFYFPLSVYWYTSKTGFILKPKVKNHKRWLKDFNTVKLAIKWSFNHWSLSRFYTRPLGGNLRYCNITSVRVYRFLRDLRIKWLRMAG